MQQLKGQQQGRAKPHDVIDCAKAARRLRSLLPLKPKQQHKPVVTPIAEVKQLGRCASFIVGEQQRQEQQQGMAPGWRLSEEEQQLQAELDELDARMANRGELRTTGP